MRLTCVLALAVLAGCFSERIDYASGEVRCSTEGKKCPPGMICGADDRCVDPLQIPDASLADGASCMEGSRSCEGLDVFVCRRGQLELDSTCGKSCLGGYCTECKPETLGCQGSQPLACGPSGNWTQADPCPADRPQCDNGLCVPPCAPAATQRCSADKVAVQECDQAGQFVNLRMCTNVCVTTPSVQCGGVCKPGTRQCGPNQTPQQCNDDGQLVDQTACAGICSRGVCEGECRPGSTRCVGEGKAESCGPDAHWSGEISDCAFVCNLATGKCDGECMPGNLTCDGSKAERCEADGYFKVVQDCGAVPCTGGECKPCTDGTTQCNGGVPQRCSGGTWMKQQIQPCAYLCDDAQGCVGECSPGSSVCQGVVRKSCGPDAHFASQETCDFACVAGECTGVCHPGSKQCNGSVSQTCNSAGQWSGDLGCAYGCNEATGECKPCVADDMSITCPAGACGERTNNCNQKVTCPACTGRGESCGGGGVAGICGCRPESLATTCQNGTRCGMVTNNCGQTVECPNTCVAPQTCGGGPVAGMCGCTGKTKEQLCAGKNCGAVTNASNTTFSCWPAGASMCSGTGQTCGGGGTANVCGCTPQCGGKTCGPDGCGGTCGSCTGGMTCNGAGQCVDVCTPLTQAQACAGKNCGTVGDGCSGSYSCWPVGQSTCPGTNQTCGGGGTANVCGCTPSCTGKVCGPDSCGGSCGPGCSSETTCSADQASCQCRSAAELCGSRNCGQLTVGSCTVTCQPNSCATGQLCDGNFCRCKSNAEFCSGKACAVNAYEGSCGPYNCGDCSDTPSTYDSCQSDFTCRCIQSWDCGTAECGGVPNGCGGTHSCGTCGTDGTCVDGICEYDPCSICCGKCCCEANGCQYCGGGQIP